MLMDFLRTLLALVLFFIIVFSMIAIRQQQSTLSIRPYTLQPRLSNSSSESHSTTSKPPGARPQSHVSKKSLRLLLGELYKFPNANWVEFAMYCGTANNSALIRLFVPYFRGITSATIRVPLPGGKFKANSRVYTIVECTAEHIVLKEVTDA